MRATGSAVLLVAAVALLRPASLRVAPRELAFLAAFGILGLAFVQFFYFVAIARLPIGIALVIQYLAPVFVALWARFVVHEPVRRRLWVAIALSLAGLTLVVELWSGFTLDGVGVAACVAAALAYAAYMLMAERSLRGGRDAASLVAWGFVFAALF
ncbi:MAG: EamA family transporter [Gaiellaceae bacterium]